MAIAIEAGRIIKSTAGCRAILLVALCAIAAWTIATRSVRAPVPDEYENYAYALAKWGVFARAGSTAREPEPGVGRAPLYPLFLAAIMRLDPRDMARAACFVEQGSKCPLRGGLAPIVQLVLAAASIFVVFEIALLFGAWPALALGVSVWAALPALELVYEFQVSEALALPLFGLASLFLALWFSGRAAIWAPAAAGGSLALLALTRVAYDYFVPVVALAVLAVAPAGAERARRRRAVAATALLVAYIALSAPWHMRNLDHFGTLRASDSGVAGVLAMRASYNRMSLEEGLVAIVYFLPGFGADLAQALFPERIVARFDFDEPDGFRQQGWAMLAEARREHAEPEAVKRALLAGMLSSPLRHALVSIPLTIDGLRYVLAMVPLALWAAVAVARQRRWWILAAAVMTLFNLAFHAGITHFRARYGLPMIYGVAPLAALGATFILMSWGRWRTARDAG